MIKNERQYRIIKAQAAKLSQDLEQIIQSNEEVKNIHPIFLKAEQDGIRNQINDLNAEIEEYESLKSGKYSTPVLNSYSEIPIALIKTRIAKGLTQKELAERIGLKEQQIQLYEATEYESASYSRLKEIIKALGIQITQDSKVEPLKITPSLIISRLKKIGLDRDFLMKRLVPSTLLDQFANSTTSEKALYQIVDRIGHIFGWTANEVIEKTEIQLETAPIAVKFKKIARANERLLNAYTLYAHYIALIVAQAMKSRVQKAIPTDPYKLRNEILSSYGTLTLENSLRYLWEHGIPVIPLGDSGSFHGACFRESGQNIIVIKQKTSSPSRWMFDAFHETWHSTQEPDKPDFVVIEAEESSQERIDSKEEGTASQFSGAILLGKRPQTLVELCLKEANRDLRMLKASVKKVAARENVPVDSLANYVAYRLSIQGDNWWGTADALQETSINPWAIARDILLEYVDLTKLSASDLSLLQQALIE